MKRSLKISLMISIIVILAVLFNTSKTFAVVRPDEVGDGDNKGIVINGTTIVENGKIVANVANVSYDIDSNTLTLNNFNGKSVRWVGMGKDFRINVVGVNTVGSEDLLYTFSGPMAGEGDIMYTNVKFIGNGTLNIISTLANIGDIVTDGPKINVVGAIVVEDGKLSIERGTLSVKATDKFFDKAVNGDNIKIDSNMNITDEKGNTVYYVEKALEYTIEDNGDGTKTYWVENENGEKIGYSQIPYLRDFCYTKEYSTEKVASNIVMKEKQVSLNKEETNTKIKLNTNSDIIPSNTVLETSVITDETTINTVKESLKEVSTKYITYDITLKSNDVVIQPNGKVKISIPIPDDYDKTKLSVYRISDNGDTTEYKVAIEENYATFETDHFSTYVLAETSVQPSSEVETNVKTPELDKTPKTGNVDYITYTLSLITISSLAGLIIIKKK